VARTRTLNWQPGEVLGYRCGSGALTLVQVLEVRNGTGARQAARCRWLRWVGDELPGAEAIRSRAARPLGVRLTVFTVVQPRAGKAEAAARIIRTGIVVVPPGAVPDDGSDRSTGACNWLTVDQHLSLHHKTDRGLTVPGAEERPVNHASGSRRA
jgi:hypothetical protein